MGVVGISIWAFGSGTGANLRTAVRLSALITAIYVLAFWSGNFYARAITGVGELIVIYGWWMWIGRRAMATGFGNLPLPQLALMLSTTTLVVGSTLGVIAQILYATGAMTPELGSKIIGGHASAQVGGYLVLTAVAVFEWRLNKSGGARTKAGLVSIYLLFLGGVCYLLGDLLAILPFTLLGTVFQIVGMVTVLVRLGPAALRAPWGSATGMRHIAIAVPFLAVSLALLVILVNMIGQVQGDFTKIPPGLIHALDHAMFIGVMTNVLFGSILAVGADQKAGVIDHAIFWGLNLGAASFVAALLFVGSGTEAIRSTAPIMGISALIGIVTYLSRLRATPAA